MPAETNQTYQMYPKARSVFSPSPEDKKKLPKQNLPKQNTGKMKLKWVVRPI